MIYYFFRLFKGNLLKHKLISSINITGLTLGLLSTILILQYVSFQWSYDDYHENAQNLYRVAYNRYQNEILQWKTANSFYPTGNYLLSNYPEVLNSACISRKYNILVTYKDLEGSITSFNEDKTYYVSSSLLDLFSIKLKSGTKEGLNTPNSVFISERASSKYFGNENPVGKNIQVNNQEYYTILGVYKDIPKNSHFQSDFLFSIEDLLAQNPDMANDWNSDNVQTYIELKTETNYKKFEKVAFNEMVNDNYAGTLNVFGWRDEYYLQPVPDIHLYSNIEYETEPPGNGKAVNILFGFAIFFLIIAWVNYVNLVTAKAIDRAKEIGIKKVNGDSKYSIVIQFIAEAFIFNILALSVVLLLWVVINPFYKHWTGIDQDFTILTFENILIASGIFVLGILLSSLYPAFILSSYKPASILKGKFGNTNQGIAFRKGLVTIQFIVSVVLLIGTLITYQQVNYLLNKDTGLNYRSKIAIKAPKPDSEQNVFVNKIKVFENQLIANPFIEDFTFTSDIPGEEIGNAFFCWKNGENITNGKIFFRLDTDYRFKDFYDIKLKAGRFFKMSDKEEHNYLILNVKGMERLGFTDPEKAIGEFVINAEGYRKCEIIGILDDFHFYSVKVNPVPIIFTLQDASKTFLNAQLNLTVMNDFHPILNELRNNYAEIFPGSPFEYSIIEQKATNDLKEDKTFATVFGIFSILAITVSIIGILGLVIITINQNLKEFGMRKVLGADLTSISKILSKRLIWEFIIALLIAIPISILGFQKWFLNNYISHIDVNWTHIIFPLLLLITVFLLIIYSQAKKVMNINPTYILKSE